VLHYEVQLKESFDKFPQVPSLGRVEACFKLLDELIAASPSPLGAFAGLIARIRDELYHSVFSEDYTSSEKEPFLERLPFFAVIGRIEAQRYA
jgi:hypothetical protein